MGETLGRHIVRKGLNYVAFGIAVILISQVSLNKPLLLPNFLSKISVYSDAG